MVGQSGGGKSTLLHVIAGISRPDSGSVIIDGIDLTRLHEAGCDKLRADKIGYVFQTFNLMPGFSELENVLLGMTFGRRKKDVARAQSLLDRVGLGHRLTHKPNQLSVGEQQRVAIARALVAEPQLLLCDEPTGALDIHTGMIVLEVIDRINRELGTTTAVITHNAAISHMANRIITMADGRISGVQTNENRVSAKELDW